MKKPVLTWPFHVGFDACMAISLSVVAVKVWICSGSLSYRVAKFAR